MLEPKSHPLKISIVTISYNQSIYLDTAIRSVIEQDYPNLEYIVVDPGSRDDSRNIIDSHRASISKVIYEPDLGPADGLNKGFSAATGDVLAFLNADDALIPGALSKVSEWFSSNAKFDVLLGSGMIVNAQGEVTRRVHPTRFTSRLYAYGAVTFLQQSTFFRRNAYLSAGGFNAENHTCWDGELFLDMALNGSKFGSLYEYLACFRIHDSSISGTGRLNEQYKKDSERLFRKAIGRGMTNLDRIRSIFYLFEKWIAHPFVSMIRIRELLR